MKTLFLLLFSVFSIFVNAQVRPYLAILKTTEGTKKGILQKTDSNFVSIHGDAGLAYVKIESIKSIKIRIAKKDYVVKNYNVNNNETYKLNAQGKYVDQWGKEEPSTQDQIIGPILTNTLVNAIGMPLHRINPSVGTFKIDYKKTRYLSHLDELSYFSIFYQANPNTKNELLKMKAISAEFKH